MIQDIKQQNTGRLLPVNRPETGDIISAVHSCLQKEGYFLGDIGQQSQESLLALLAPLGEVWHPDHAVMTVAPIPGGQFVAQMDVEIRPHNECAYAQDPPRYLALYCVSNEAIGGDVYLIKGYEIMAQLSNEQRSLLRQVLFNCDPGVGLTFQTPCLRNLGGYECLIYTAIGCSEDWQENHYYQVVDNYAPEASKALLNGLHQLLRQPAYRYYHRWQAGELLIFNNWHFLHGREAFKGQQRELLHVRIR